MLLISLEGILNESRINAIVRNTAGEEYTALVKHDDTRRPCALREQKLDLFPHETPVGLPTELVIDLNGSLTEVGTKLCPLLEFREEANILTA